MKRWKVYTKYGDKGDTGLLYGGRVSKADLRLEAYGSVDEAVSALGLARALSQNTRVREIVYQLQKELFTVGAELATSPEEYDKLKEHFSTITPEMVQQLEDTIDALDAEMEVPKAFIIPGATPGSAAMDLARTVIRRAERRAVELKDKGLLANPVVITYLNRLSDLAFTLSRYEEKSSRVEFEVKPSGRKKADVGSREE